MDCASCGRSNGDGARFCSGCGLSLAQHRVCPTCGRENATDARFCDACGAALGAAPTESPSSESRLYPPLPSSVGGGRYVVRSFLGEGAKKRVYLAHDNRLDRDIALALIKSDGLDADGLVRVRREAQAMGRLGDHQHIVTVFDVGEQDGQPFIVSQYLSGGSLEDALEGAEQHRLPVERAVQIGLEICDALEHAHTNGVVHRDLKPGNIWLSQDGGAKLGDFGLALAMDQSRLTVAGTMVGTVAYMAPEQALGGAADARSDLYALGAALYQMVTGRPPFVGDDAVAVISQHINTPPVSPAWLNPEVPRSLDALIMRLLEKDPARRPQTAAEVSLALASAGGVAGTRSESIVATPQPGAAADPVYRRAFVGREAELRQLQAAFDGALSGEGALMMVVGEPGIGKTSVCEQLATYAALRGGRTLVGHCYEEGSLSLPYLPFVEAMRSYVLSSEPDALERELASGAGDVARIVSEIRQRVEVELPSVAAPEEERYRLLQAVTAFLRNASATQPLVIVLEDLHDADRGTLDLLIHLARNLAGARVLVIGTYRDVEVDRTHPLASALVELRRSSQFGRVLLRGLTIDEVQRMLSAIANQDVGWGLAEAVHRQTEGNPLFVQEVTRYLAEEGLVTHEDGRWRSTTEQLELAIPEGLRDVVGKRLSRLSDGCNRLLAMAAVIGREFSLGTLRALAGVSEEDLLGALEEAIRVGVLEERSRGGDVRYRFAHAFFRQSLYEELIAPRRIRLHQQVAQALEEQYAGRLEEHAVEMAEHFSHSSAPDELAKAVRYGKMAAERASAVYAHSEAAALLRRALEVQEVLDPDDWVSRYELLVAALAPHRFAGDIEHGRPMGFEAAELARTAGDHGRLVRAAVAMAEYPLIASIADPQSIALAQEALDAAPEGDSLERARLLSRLATQYGSVGDFAASEPVAVLAIEMARRIGDQNMLGRALSGYMMGTRLNKEQRVRTIAELAALQEASDSLDQQALAHLLRGVLVLLDGDLAGAEKEAQGYAAIADRYQLAAQRVFALLWQADLLRIRGDFEGARRLLDEAGEKDVMVWHAFDDLRQSTRNMLLLADLGGLDEIAEVALGLSTRFPDARLSMSTTMFVATRLGRLDLSRRELERAAAIGFATLSEDRQWGTLAATIAEACWALGDVETAAAAYPHMGELSGQSAMSRTQSPYWRGPGDRYRGLLATVMGRWDDAEQHFADAIAFCEAMPSPPTIAQLRFDWADMLLRRDGTGDRERAIGMLNEAADAAGRMGMKPLLDAALQRKLDAQGAGAAGIMTSITAVSTAVQRERTDLSALATSDGTVTIMFGDIEQSTSVNHLLGDERYTTLLREYVALVRSVVERRNGHVVKLIGDGFMAAFPRPDDALRAALDVQRSIAGETLTHPVALRIGLHTGSPVQEGADFFGIDVTLASRIADRAGGGEILVSEALRAAAGAGMTFGEPRDIDLKGLPGGHVVFGLQTAE